MSHPCIAFSFAGDALLGAKGDEEGWRPDVVPTAKSRWLLRRNDRRVGLPIHGVTNYGEARTCVAEAPASRFCRSPLAIANQ